MATYSNLSFAAQVEAIVNLTVEKLEIVFHESVQRVIADMQRTRPAGGNLPIDLGFLRASLTASLNSPSTGVTVPSTDTGAFAYNEGNVNMIILAAVLGDTIYAVYTAAYARRMEYGFVGTDSLGRTYNQQGYGFVRLAAQKWSTIVDEVVAEVARRLG